MKPDWTPAQTTAAMQMRAVGNTYAAIGTHFDRTAHAVKRHLQYRREFPPPCGLAPASSEGDRE